MEKIDRNEIFRQGTIRICGSLDINVAIEQCHRYLGRFVPIEGMGIDHYDEEQNLFKNIARIDEAEPGSQAKPVLLLPEESRELWREFWLYREEVEIINRPGQRPEFVELGKIYDFDLDFSLIIMRLALGGERIGLFYIATPGNDRYTAEHADLVRLLREPLAIAMANALRHKEVLRLKDMLDDTNRFLQDQLREMAGAEIIGAEFGLRHVMEMVGQVAQLESPVLLQGETGVGKGVIANAIHRSSPRKAGPFVNVNCGAIPDTLLDSELFGHEKGAFTGAIEQKIGRFERAGKGTIFLDEIGELTLQAQVRLLNVIQNREIERVGGSAPIPVNIRIVSATHRNLGEMVRAGKFREDLWYRLNVFPIQIPPLRQRKEDIPALVHHFIEKKCIELKKHNKPLLGHGAMDRLTAYGWQGNVRELQNIVERALIRHKGGDLYFMDLFQEGDGPSGGVSPQRFSGKLLSLDEMNREHIERALSMSEGKINGPGGAAKILNIHPNTLRRRMDKLQIPYKRKDPSARFRPGSRTASGVAG